MTQWIKILFTRLPEIRKYKFEISFVAILVVLGGAIKFFILPIPAQAAECRRELRESQARNYILIEQLGKMSGYGADCERRIEYYKNIATDKENKLDLALQHVAQLQEQIDFYQKTK